ncbi:MAG: ABC transporter permease [Kouleothrix sp.]|jgi:peptide/nickel transport system permease protein|nr:ABC transporter permease [Kouleothrix sp.]
MLQYIGRRILTAIPVLLGVMLVTFAMARLIPGGPCVAMLGEKARPEVCARFNHEKGFDRPIPVQLAVYARDVATGDLGTSIRFNRAVTQIIVERLPLTIELGLVALLIATLVGIPAGIISAIRRNSAIDVATMVGANVGVSMPVFWLGLMLAYVFALVFKGTPLQLPPSGRLSAGLTSVPFFQVFGVSAAKGSFQLGMLQFFANLYVFNSLITGQWAVLGDAIKHLILPSFALATIPMSIIARMTRASMLDVLGRDYVRTARAKGLANLKVIMRHAFKNALLPIATIIGLQLGAVFSGAVLTETIFGLAGVGRMLFEAITARDYPVIQGFTLVIAFGYVAVNLVVDLSYALFDPRIRLE